MKKFLSMLVALSLIAPAVLVGCGEEAKKAPAKKTEPAKAGEKKEEKKEEKKAEKVEEKKEEKKAEPAKAPEAPKAEEKKAPEAPKAPEKAK
jgi:hypothetical protein